MKVFFQYITRVFRNNEGFLRMPSNSKILVEFSNNPHEFMDKLSWKMHQYHGDTYRHEMNLSQHLGSSSFHQQAPYHDLFR